MPGTRKKVVSTGPDPTRAEDESSPKKSKQNKDKSKPDLEESDSSPLPANTPQTKKQKKEAAVDESLESKSGRRGRPRKGETAGVCSPGSNKSKDGDKTPSSPKPKETAEASAVFSPRRSGRSVVPNRRFQDMELDFGAIGRKRPKEESADAPPPKRAKASAKKQSEEKGKSSPVKRVTAKQGITESEVRAGARVPTTGTAVQAKSVTVSAPIFTAVSSPQTAQPSVSAAQSPISVVTSTVLSSPLRKSTAVPSSPSKQVPRRASATVVVSPSQVYAVTSIASQMSSASGSARSAPSSASTVCSPSSVSRPLSADSAGAVCSPSSGESAKTHVTGQVSSKQAMPVSQAMQTSTSVTAVLSPTTSAAASSVIASRTVSITSSLCVQTPSGCEVTTITESPEKEAHDRHAVSALSEGRRQDSAQSSSCSESVLQSDIAEPSSAVVTGLNETAEVEIIGECEQVGDQGAEIVTISPSPHSLVGDRDRWSGDTPGRVVGKPLVPSSSKSVFIVRHPPSQSESSSEDKGHQKQSSLSTALTEVPSRITTVSKAAEVREVMSIVELSPNKKVPVVLAERKENAGKLVKVISSQQIQQLPPAVQKVVSARSVSLKEGSSVSLKEGSSESLPQQQQKTVTVRISNPPQSASESEVCTKSDVSPRKKDSSSNNSAPTDQESTKKISTQTSTSSGQGSLLVSLDVQEANIDHASTASNASETEVGMSQASSTSCEEKELREGGEGDEEGVKGKSILVSREKYVTSGTQTPYTKNYTKKVITVHVHPPSKDGEKNTEIVSVTKVEKDDPASDVSDSDEKEESQRPEGVSGKRKYIFVDLPEGSTVKKPYHVHSPDKLETGDVVKMDQGGEVAEQEGRDKKDKYVIVDLPQGATVKQPYARRTERIDSDPDFYTMDEKGLFTCHICQYQSYRRANFYKHKKKHLGLRPYACDQCPYRAATTSNLKRHQEIHKDIRSHKCPVCDLNFRQKIHLERHIKYRHEEKKVRCPLCDYVCANENPDLKIHIRRRHIPQLGSQEAINTFKCGECGVVANSKRDLRQHLKFHSKGPELKLFCNMCSFVTDCESRLRRHQYIHTKEKPFQCGLCDYRGSQKEHVLRHMRTQHNIEIERKHRVKKQAPEKVPEGEASSKGLEKADYTSDEKIFACNHCNMKFSKLLNLYKHLHTQHRDIMPTEKDDFSCVVCDFRTSNKKNLLVHMRRHNLTDQSPPSHVYSCVLCRYMNPKRRNLFQHMRKKHHIEIVMRDDGSSTCYVPSDPASAVGANSGSVAGSQTLSPTQTLPGTESVVNVLPLTNLISTVTQPSELQVVSDTGAISMNTSTVPATIKMEDLALVVSNPHTAATATAATSGREAVGMGTALVDGSTVETFTIGTFSQDDAAEAIQGLQALAQRGVLDSSTIVEEQVQVMGSDDQTTLVIDPAGLGGVVDQLVQPKAEPLQVVEIDNTQLLDQDPSSSSTTTSLLAHNPPSILGDTTPAPVAAVQGEGAGFQLSAEQWMNLSTGDYLEINGEMFKVEVSTENPQGQQIISFEPATSACPEDIQEPLEPSEVSLESAPELS